MRKPHPHTSSDGVTTYKVRFRLNGKQSSETFDTKREAEQFAKLLDALGPQGALDRLYVDDQVAASPTLDELAADHIRYLTGVEEGTKLDYSRLWKRTWSPLLGPLHVSPQTITKDAVSEAVNKLAQRYSPKSLKNQRGLLAAVLDRAIDQGLLVRNPTKGLRLPDVTIDPDDADDDMVLLSMEEFDAFCGQFDGTYRTLVRFLAGTGCRWGEAVVLRRRDLNLTGPHPVVRIRRALKRSGDGAVIIRGPKSKKSRRTVTLPRELAPELEALIEGSGADDLVFTGARGGMIAHRNFWAWQWRPAIWRAQHCPEHTDEKCRCGSGRPKSCPTHPGEQLPSPCNCPGTLPTTPRIHDLRHTHASWLLAAGVPIHVVQARLGHESIQTTVDTYSHMLPDAQLQAARATELAFQPRQLD